MNSRTGFCEPTTSDSKRKRAEEPFRPDQAAVPLRSVPAGEGLLRKGRTHPCSAHHRISTAGFPRFHSTRVVPNKARHIRHRNGNVIPAEAPCGLDGEPVAFVVG